MQFLNLLALVPFVVASVNASPANAGTARAEAAALACNCQHNNDAGRFRDVLKPSDRVNELCQQGGGCYQAEAGRMCVQGSLGQCACAVQAARDWESWHGDWFLWSAIDCSGLVITIT